MWKILQTGYSGSLSGIRATNTDASLKASREGLAGVPQVDAELRVDRSRADVLVCPTHTIPRCLQPAVRLLGPGLHLTRVS
jgi:hypothetical protein